LIGYAIVNYEQNGEDRAKYGEHILEGLADKIDEQGLSFRNLKYFRQFYLAFPELASPVAKLISSMASIGQTASAQLQISDLQTLEIRQTPSAQFETEELLVDACTIFDNLSFSHLSLLMSSKDKLEKAFYEIEAMKGTWSVRELKRQIDSNLYFRTGLSGDKNAVIALANRNAEKTDIRDIIRSPYSFDFLKLKAKDVIEESDLESALMDHLQEVLLEMGNGFCFEARQKRIVIDDKYYFYDLLFYNRVLHCGVIVELKSRELDYTDMAQLQLYVNYYRKNMMSEGDNPPVGILLCTEAGKEMVEYSTPGIDENIFISTYMLHLPKKEELLNWLQNEKGK